MNHLEQESKKSPRIFVSYPIEDNIVARSIVQGLRSREVTILDTDTILTGELEYRSLRETISAGDYFLLIVSNNSAGSSWQNADIASFLQEL